MEELLEIKSLKEKHSKELEILQAQLVKEKANLAAIRKLTAAEKIKDQKINGRMDNSCRYGDLYQKHGFSQYQRDISNECHDSKVNFTVISDAQRDKRYQQQETRNGKIPTPVSSSSEENKPERPRYISVPSLHEYQSYFNFPQNNSRYRNDERRSSLDILTGIKSSHHQMSSDREDVLRSEMLRQQNNYIHNMSQGFAYTNGTQRQAKSNHNVEFTPNYPDSIPMAHQNHTSLKINPHGPSQYQSDRAKTKDRISDAVCEGCGKMANFMCSACKGVHYCTTQCQVSASISYFT